MGSVVRRTLQLACLFFGGYLAVVWLGPFSLDSMATGRALGLSAATSIGLAAAFVLAISAARRAERTTGQPGSTPQPELLSAMGDAAFRRDWYILFLVPKAGSAPISSDMRSALADAAQILAEEMGGAETESVIVMPEDWPAAPVRDTGTFRDPAAMAALLGPMNDILRRRGVPQSGIDAFLSAPFSPRDYGPVITVDGLVPITPTTDVQSARQRRTETPVEGAPSRSDGPSENRSITDTSESKFTCEICMGVFPEASITHISADRVQQRCASGHVPQNLPPDLRMTSETTTQLQQAWALIAAAKTDEWRVCPDCADDIERG